ncbi:MAG: hypothetical protein JNG90_10545 [Planctomycetaceae bacterium]|nr:hypothetical protein [Planctomycetaceae bacterium]
MTVALFVVCAILTASVAAAAEAPELLAGVAKIDITDRRAGPVNDPLYVKALVLQQGDTRAAIITVDAVAIGEIGPIGNGYLPAVRARLEKDLGIPPAHVLANASHCHGIVCADVEQRTVQAVQEAVKNLTPVRVGVGTGQENRIMINRRLKLKNGRELDVRHAYSLPPDDEIEAVGPVDSEIGLLRLDREDGRTLAVVYNFACHPIQGVPSGGNTADITGFASRVIEGNLSEGAVALFLQGCAGDVNPVTYKTFDVPRDAESLGNLLGLSVLQATRQIRTTPEARFKLVQKTIELPRADVAQRIIAMEAEQQRLAQSLGGTTLNLKTFVPLLIKYKLAPEFPASPAFEYLQEKARGRGDLARLDSENRKNLEQYIANIQAMEQLTRLNTNLALLRKHQADNVAAGRRTIAVEVLGLRVGEFVLVTFPGELTVETGLAIKKASPHPATFVAGYTNGYIYYAPTSEQLANVGGAQEDSDCILAPEWQRIYLESVSGILKGL